MEQFNEAATFAQSHEIPWARDPTTDTANWGIHHDDPPPFNRLRGPVHPRGGVSGVIPVCMVRKSPPGVNPIVRTRRSASRRRTWRCSRASRIRAGCSNRASA